MKTLLLGIAVILFGIALIVGLKPLGLGLIGVIVSVFGLAFAIAGYLGKEKKEPLAFKMPDHQRIAGRQAFFTL